MDIPKLNTGSGSSHKKLVKNSLIAVTIDDLNEGLIVVSFSHEDSVYQGVLLQLNRERGIPCGISFPKDYCTDSVTDPTTESDPTQIPPLVQRHTYFQDKDGILSDPRGLRSRLALRRVIKPPARFKNSRMSLRLRSRPVLCAKCRSLCEEKVTSQSDETKTDASDSSRKLSPTVTLVTAAHTTSGVTTRRSKSKIGVPSTSSNPTPENKLVEDYSYVIVGNKTCVENYWKRPSLLPAREEESGRVSASKPLQPCQSGGPNKPLSEPVVIVKSVPNKMLKKASNPLPVHENKLTLTLTKDNNNRVLPKLLVSSHTCSEKTVKLKKSKICKPKLFSEFSDPLTKDVEKIEEETVKVKKESLDEGQGDKDVQESLNESDFFDEGGLKFDMNPNSKMWENRIRKKSAVPVRFRDEGYVTKNIFSFKRRREDENLQGDESPEDLTGFTALADEMDQDTLATNMELRNLSPDGSCSSTEMIKNCSPPPGIAAVGSGANGHLDTKNEPAKTPVIKISFGSPGNGVVVEIPPKTKQEETESLVDKAARKALKKAKKEAKRKLSISRESSPSRVPATLPALSPLIPEQTLAVPVSDESVENAVSSSPRDTASEIHHVPKKKKKEKKKKRSKSAKENGDSILSHGLCNSPPKIQEESAENNDAISHDTTNSDCLKPHSIDIPHSISGNPQLPASANVSDDDDKKTESTPSSNAEAPQRLCISLKRLNDNSIVSWDITQSCITCSHNELDSGNTEQVGSPTGSEPNDYPMNDSPSNEERNANASSIDSYVDEYRNYIFKKGDIIWGKLPGCPWWPGKILEILFVDVEDVSARVSWYRASTLSFVRFSQLSPFAEQFEARYARSRKRGSYQHAVRDALVEAHQLDPTDLPSD